MSGQTRHDVFAATTPNIGTTTLAMCHALELARERDRQVVFVCLNLKSAHAHTYFGVQPKVSLDQLLPDLHAKCLSNDRLEEALVTPIRAMSNLRLLCGNLQRERAEFVQADDVAYLLQRIAERADALVIDVAAAIDNAATLYCINQPWTITCVTTNAVQHFAHDFRAGLGRLQTVYRLPIQFNQVLVRILPGEPYSLPQIAKVIGAKQVVGCPHVEGLGRALQTGRYMDAILGQREAA